jgi:flagellar hook protein FlgE
MDGDLSAAGTIATQGTQLDSQALVDGGSAAATGATALSDVRSAADPGTVLFGSGDVITVNGITRGGRAIPPQTFTVGQTGNTLGDFAAWLQGVAGIQTGAGLAGNPGIVIENGAIVVRGNASETNALTITGNDITSTNASSPLPFSFTEVTQANGSGVFTSFTVYDSLGNPVNIHATFALDSTPATGPVWRFYLDAPDGAGILRPVGTGTIAFDTRGNFISTSGNQFSIDRSGTGAASPQQITLDFSSLNGMSTIASNVIMAQQDGYPPGTLTNYGIGPDGTISGTFSNGLSRTLGQVALAVFPNPEAMIALPDNLYVAGPNTGTPTITSPGLQNAGTVLGGALELSNVDLSTEFVGLITSSAGFQAASRVISTSSDMLDQLLLIAR